MSSASDGGGIMASDMAMVTCARCGTRYSAERESCPNCTLVFPPDEMSHTRPLKRPPTLSPQPSSASEELTPHHVVLLQAVPSGMCIALPRDAVVILGRSVSGVLLPDHPLVALDKLDAQQHGVSRQHCLIERRASGLTVSEILTWVNHIDLFRIKGVAEEYADLLEQSGVDTVVELAQRNPNNLFKRMNDINQEKKLVRRTPHLSDVQSWVEQAKNLKRLIHY